MNVATYTFQSSYPSPVQVGKLDQASVKEDESVANKTTENEKFQELKQLDTTEQKSSIPSFDSSQKVDFYA